MLFYQYETTAQKLAAFIRTHNIEAVAVDNKIIAEDRYTKDGVLFTESITLNADRQEILNWLGY